MRFGRYLALEGSITLAKVQGRSSKILATRSMALYDPAERPILGAAETVTVILPQRGMPLVFKFLGRQ